MVPASTRPSEPGDRDSEFLAMYQELRRLAHQMFAREPSQTLQATALVNEAFLRLRHCGDATAADPARFRRAAAVAMRRILVDHARSRGALRRGGGKLPTSLDSVELATAGDLSQVLAVDEAIERLQAESPELAEVVRLRFYAGLQVAEVARTLDRSERSVQRDWTFAKARLYRFLREQA
ncbi:MAG: sigma-70 family RNA polymerase sigma factor [Planctomycetes bacterium]|nr:sigma-70 family RNA polymerase sigma factor [Planctomycetota bacterium]